MDIKNDLVEKDALYWVEKLERHTGESVELWGTPLACSFGFGNVDARLYKGGLACISDSKYWHAENATVSQAHTTRGGFFWNLQADKLNELPDAPFLVTSNTALRLVRTEEVAFYPKDKWADLYEDKIREVTFYLWCPEWLGILVVDKSRSIERGTLRVFSDRSDVAISPEQTLNFTVDPEDEFGTVTPISEGGR